MCKGSLSFCVALIAGLPFMLDRAWAAGSMAGWWKLDDGSGTVAKDSSGSGRDGTLVNGPVWTAGKLGGALEFNGKDSFVRVPDSSALTFAVTDSYTLAAWVYLPNVPAGWHGIVCKGRQAGGAAAYYGLWIGDNGGTPTWYYGTWPAWGNPVPGSGWYHVVITQDGAANSKTLYVNGQLDAQRTAQAADAPGALVFGSDREPGDSLAGKIDDVQLYRRSVTAEQVLSMFQGALPSWPKAQNPEPADGATGIISPLLRWTAGEGAAFHNVYLGTTPELTEADRVATRLSLTSTMYWHQPGLASDIQYFWRVDEIAADGVTITTGDVWRFFVPPLTAHERETFDATTLIGQDSWGRDFRGLFDDVRIYTKALTKEQVQQVMRGDPLVAWNPQPGRAAHVDIRDAQALNWSPGDTAVEHDVYFGADQQAVGAAEANSVCHQGRQAKESYSLAGLVEFGGGNYAWRIDEIDADGGIHRGNVWEFMVPDYLIVDDFERYTDEEGTNSRIYETWIDGYSDGSSGSTVGYVDPPFAEQNIVHSGGQAMPFDYNNLEGPSFSEAVRTFESAQDWTIFGVDTLTLHFRGKVSNGVDRLYAALEDAGGTLATVFHPDPAAVQATKWIEWKVPLSQFTGVDLARIKKLYLGVGNRARSSLGGAGQLYIDDIRVTKP